MNRKSDLTTRTLLLTIPFTCVSCATTSWPTAQQTSPRTFDIVNEPIEAPIEPYARLDAVQHGYDYDFEEAADIRFVNRSSSRHSGQTSLIGLYGEIGPNTWNAKTPSDGGRNLSQITFADEGACFDPDLDRSGRRLVFASTRHSENSDLYLKSTTGKTITQITSDPAAELMPAFDPTGRQIAYTSDRTGNWDIFITTPEGDRSIQLTTSQDDELHPTWSPDGRWIAYCKFGSQSGRWEIWLVEVSNPAIHSFLDYGLFPNWCPDVTHNKILFQRSRQRGSRYHSIWTIDIFGNESRYPTEIVSAANAAVINPSWSPDGNRITFVTVVDPDEDGTDLPAQSDVWVVNLDGTDRIMLSNGQFANFQPVWSSDGSVYFISNRSGHENIWSIGMNGSNFPPNTTDSGIANVDGDDRPPFDR